LSLWLIKYCFIKEYGGVDVKIHVFLTSALGGVVSFTLLQLYPRRKSPRYPLDRRLIHPRIGLDDVEEKKSRPYRDSNSV
jgi:hypothetical protein